MCVRIERALVCDVQAGVDLEEVDQKEISKAVRLELGGMRGDEGEVGGERRSRGALGGRVKESGHDFIGGVGRLRRW